VLKIVRAEAGVIGKMMLNLSWSWKELRSGMAIPDVLPLSNVCILNCLSAAEFYPKIYDNNL
jgi:hypothetical protein